LRKKVGFPPGATLQKSDSEFGEFEAIFEKVLRCKLGDHVDYFDKK
jgi:hypothetical protein